MEGPPQMNTTATATNTTTTSANNNATATPDEQGEGDEHQQQQQTIEQYQHRCWNNNHSWQSKQLLFMYHLF
jgi:hypothetical protein